MKGQNDHFQPPRSYIPEATASYIPETTASTNVGRNGADIDVISAPSLSYGGEQWVVPLSNR